MNFEDSGDNSKNLSAADLAAREVDTRNEAVSDAGDERLKAFQEELSGTTNRPERFGVGDNSRGAKSALERQTKSTGSFMAVASAQAYNQPVTFNVGGRDVSMSLGDLRNIASELRNRYGDKIRGGNASDKDKDRMKSYGGLLQLIDNVAAGKASPNEVAEYMQKHDLNDEVIAAAQRDPNVKVADVAPQDTEAKQAGAFTDQSLDDQTLGAVDAIFGKS